MSPPEEMIPDFKVSISWFSMVNFLSGFRQSSFSL